MITEQDIVFLGTCARTHGNRGEVQVTATRALLEEAEDKRAENASDKPLFVLFELDRIFTPFRLTDWRSKGADSYLLRLAGVDTEAYAQRLCGNRVFLLREDLTDDPDDPLLTWDDLIGYEVVDIAAGKIGVVKQVDDSTLNTLLMLEDGTILPAHEDLIEEIDTEGKRLVVNLPEGIL
ncbi:MAG: 16S rRNA processing protein RimM [Paludibacteraceae bacterium]|nr:16S rRNA processing protein RimM [Paludibacteraceae bacterium]